MQDKTIIIVMLGILTLVIGLVVWSAGRVALAIVRDRLHRHRPQRQFRHPSWGRFTYEDGLWSGELPQPDRTLRLVVGGNADAPSEALLAQAEAIRNRFPELERQALEFLRQREVDIREARLDFYLLRQEDEERSDTFTFEFLDPRDDSRVWRVEFVKQEPRYTGFDS